MINVEWAGTVPYIDSWEWQKKLVNERIKSPDLIDKLILLEHPHTYTLGRRGKIENLLWDETILAERNITVHRVDRGGDITYHGPGQLVGYPILNLKRIGRYGLSQIKTYVHDIEEVIIQTLAAVGVNGRRYDNHVGVWVEEADGLNKIAAIGVHINHQGITSHGFALNVSPDLSYFTGIVPCGITDHGVTSVENVLKRPLPITNILPPLLTAFEHIFKIQVETNIKR